jgi:hypothetical protein
MTSPLRDIIHSQLSYLLKTLWSLSIAFLIKKKGVDIGFLVLNANFTYENFEIFFS